VISVLVVGVSFLYSDMMVLFFPLSRLKGIAILEMHLEVMKVA